MDRRYGARSGQYGLCYAEGGKGATKHRFQFHTTGKLAKKSAKAARKLAKAADSQPKDTTDAPKSLATPLMSMRAGIKRFGDAAIESIRKEMKQLHT